LATSSSFGSSTSPPPIRRATGANWAIIALLEALPTESRGTSTGWMLVALGALLLAVKESCAFTQRAWLTATIVVGLLAFTALFVFLRHRRTQRVIHRTAP